MLLANVAVAERIYETFPQCSVLRRHPTPPDSNFEPLVRAVSVFVCVCVCVFNVYYFVFLRVGECVSDVLRAFVFPMETCMLPWLWVFCVWICKRVRTLSSHDQSVVSSHKLQSIHAHMQTRVLDARITHIQHPHTYYTRARTRTHKHKHK